MALSPFSATWRTDLIRYFVGGPASSTNNAAARFDGTTGKLIKNSALLIDTNGGLSRSGNGGITIQGTNTNDSAAAGDVGELVESNLAVGSAVNLSSGTSKTITSISLTAGHWQVWVTPLFAASGGAAPTRIGYSVSTTADTMGDIAMGRAQWRLSFTVDQTQEMPTVLRDLQLSATTTVYLVGVASFAAGSVSAYGYIAGRRVR